MFIQESVSSCFVCWGLPWPPEERSPVIGELTCSVPPRIMNSGICLRIGPDATESPITVDAGRFVIEASYFDWRRDQGIESQTILSTNLKLGLSENTDLQFVFDGFTREGNRDSGFENVQLRVKRNLWGNDGGKSALSHFSLCAVPRELERVGKGGSCFLIPSN